MQTNVWMSALMDWHVGAGFGYSGPVRNRQIGQTSPARNSTHLEP